MGVCLWWGVRELVNLRQAVGRHIRLEVGWILGVVDGWLGHESIAVYLGLRLSLRTNRLADHVRSHSPDVIP